MGHGTDLPILRAIFDRGLTPPYLGVIGSRAKRKILLRELAERGVSPDSIGEFYCPIGLPLGTNQPAEIAISITAQLLQRRDALRAKQSPDAKGCGA
jgi:xanthine dehydrogenase accessory factor